MNANLIPTFVAVAADAVASISGFGIGGILTPLLASWAGSKLAVVSLPHFIKLGFRLLIAFVILALGLWMFVHPGA